jgi:hypothetical protein
MQISCDILKDYIVVILKPYKYMNCKRKLLHCNAKINFNKIFLKEKIIPKYAFVRIPTINEAAKKLIIQAQTLRIKCLYKMKQQFNLKLHISSPHK